MYYLIYKITNTINGKIYIGCHQTHNIDDNYMGSGKLLKRAQKKYGIENFSKEILEMCDSLEEMFLRESELVDSEFVRRSDTYNLKQGGKNWDIETARRGRELADRVLLEKYGENYKKVMSSMGQDAKAKIDGMFKGIAEKSIRTRLQRYGHAGTFYGKTHSEETKQKISSAKKNTQLGENNSQYGTCWIYSPTLKENKKIQKIELSMYLQQGWIKGRKIKID